MLGNTPNQPSKFRAKNWLEIMMTHVKHVTLASKLSERLRY